MVEMQYVQSSNIEAIGYDGDNMELHVRFLTTGLYVYLEVPEEVFAGLCAAPSKGSYLNRVVKGVYRYEQR